MRIFQANPECWGSSEDPYKFLIQCKDYPNDYTICNKDITYQTNELLGADWLSTKKPDDFIILGEFTEEDFYYGE